MKKGVTRKMSLNMDKAPIGIEDQVHKKTAWMKQNGTCRGDGKGEWFRLSEIPLAGEGAGIPLILL
jgi:hypothetical protein